MSWRRVVRACMSRATRRAHTCAADDAVPRTQATRDACVGMHGAIVALTRRRGADDLLVDVSTTLLGNIVEQLDTHTFRVQLQHAQYTQQSTATRDACTASCSNDSNNNAYARGGSATCIATGTHVCIDGVTTSTTTTAAAATTTATGPPTSISGYVLKVNKDATCIVASCSAATPLCVPLDKVCVVQPHWYEQCNDDTYTTLRAWLQTTIDDASDCDATTLWLHSHGWRVDDMHLLSAADVAALTFLPRVGQRALLEKAQWHHECYNAVRDAQRERVKDRDVRYATAKYKGAISCAAGICVVVFIFTTNLQAYRKQQRRYKILQASACIDNKSRPQQSSKVADKDTRVCRDREEQWMRQVLRKLDAAHPRIVVLTGFAGCGKSTVCRAAIAKEGASAVHVDVYGADSALRGVVKALGVQNVDACGDLLDFVTEACQQYTAASGGGGGGGTMPLLVLKLREGSDFRRVYDEAVTLACGHKACHVIIEVPLESLTMADVALPRLDFYAVPNFSEAQAYAYTEHSIDPVAMHHFVRVAGTNSNDLDELYAAVHHRKMSATEYTSRKLVKAMQQVQAACAEQPRVRAALTQLAAFAFDEGQHAGVDAASLASAAVRDIVLYDPVRDRWLFRNTTLHTAVRCCA